MGTAIGAAELAHTDGLLFVYDHRSDGIMNTDPTPLVQVYGSASSAVFDAQVSQSSAQRERCLLNQRGHYGAISASSITSS